jgi:hypothetical protein
MPELTAAYPINAVCIEDFEKYLLKSKFLSVN